MNIMLLKIYKKELIDSIRDKRTLMLSVFLPIIMMTGLTFFYESMISDDSGQIYTLAVDESLSKAELDLLDAEGSNIELVLSKDPEAALEDGDAMAALILSDDFLQNVQNGQQAEATIVGDSFSQNSSALMNNVTLLLSSLENAVIAERLEAQGTNLSVIQPFTVTHKEMSDEDPNINLIAMLIPMILAISIGIGSSPAGTDLFAGEKERKTMEALLMTPVNRGSLMLAKWLTISTIGAITGIITLAVVALEIGLFTENLKKSVSFGDQAGIIIGVAILLSIIYAMFNATLLMLTSILGKTIKEAQSYITPVMMLGIFPTMIISTVGVNELGFAHFAIPILNVFSLLKELLFGIVDIEHILITCASNLIAMAVVFLISRILFMKDKWVMN